ncbi:MAG: multicopper oxidase domain-containing protein [Bacteroidetes bacterium]|jgi:bilirubin oxidase|nr:multicopper oxidase domain-containing protein [Bacteroidota bacterium]MBK7568694.1 multicopper oxidase domain-containing protein [Bacteroidota bacterium]MBP8915607.1 multicopper oxidase domain-containing protein [Chitinophagales bacterium]MBP9189735.1 multicopper oxidase domain-containing protein [Chitinophagales bacterium]MBP9794601.1 multicopper oxidase domain-containing protein [Chitinophagales bacterium]
MKKSLLIILLSGGFLVCKSQNPLLIPPVLSGTNFDLSVQNGMTQFFPGINTPTYGINGNILGPTLIVNKWDSITINVTNNLTGTGNSTTMHWHGLHVPAHADGGPHQIIEQGTTWSPQFQILNNASTFWYHPHGEGKTDLQVSRGLAGFIIVKDSAEAELGLPRTYGVDDFPLVVQSKAFDVLNQIAISTEEDTLICVNGTVDPYLDAPAQIIRLRLLNGSSMRVYNFGLSNDQEFVLIGTDGGLLNDPIPLSRILLGPGERAEILVDLQTLAGQTIYLKSFSSEIENGIYGAATVTGMMGGEIPNYDLNPLNGADFDILQINVVEQNADPISTIPSILIVNTPYTDYDNSRVFNLQPDEMMDPEGQVMGPFNINGDHFDIMTINQTVYLNDVELWRIVNNTGIAHPFHIHDIQFYIDNINGGPVPIHLQGLKDVVLVKPMEYVEVITKFDDFADNYIPYMYHCHMLHHEDDGMMGSFRVIDTSATSILDMEGSDFQIFPNPVTNTLFISLQYNLEHVEVRIVNNAGQIIIDKKNLSGDKFFIDVSVIPPGSYILELILKKEVLTKIFIK